MALPHAEEASVEALEALAPRDEEDLAVLLRESGLDPARYGSGAAKPLAGLLAEIERGECSLRRAAGGSLERLVEPVFVRLWWGDRVLVEVEQRFGDGRRRQRNMVLAEKRSPEDADADAAALRGLAEELELELEPEGLRRLVEFDRDSCACVAERRESPSYPGLQCVYHTHNLAMRLTEAGEAHFGGRGLLEERFETSEADKVNVWQWMPLQTARELKVKGFLEPSAGGRQPEVQPCSGGAQAAVESASTESGTAEEPDSADHPEDSEEIAADGPAAAAAPGPTNAVDHSASPGDSEEIAAEGHTAVAEPGPTEAVEQSGPSAAESQIDATMEPERPEGDPKPAE